MSTYTKVLLSGSTSGKAIKVAATATLGTTIHTAHATSLDEVWLWVWNSAATDKLLTIEWGGVTDPDNIMEYTVPSIDGWYLVVPGHLLTGGLVVTAFAETADVLTITGFVNRIT